MKQIILVGAVAALTLPLAVGCCLCGGDEPVPNPDAPDKYAVLASSEVATEDDVKYNSEFWYDLVLTYCTLIKQGFEKDNIFVLYGDGRDGLYQVGEDSVFLVGQEPSSKYDPYKAPFCDGDVTLITDISLWKTKNVAKDNLCNVLCCLSAGRPAELKNGRCKCLSSGDSGVGGFKCSDKDIPWLTSEDFLVTWVKGHGGTTTCDTKLGFKEGFMLKDQEMAELFDELKPERWALMFETCNSGGWLDNFPSDDTTTVMISSGNPKIPGFQDCKETSWTAAYDEKDAIAGVQAEIVHGRFTYWLNTAFRQLDLEENPIDSDVDGNNLVSTLEDYSLAAQEINAENSAFVGNNETDFGGVMHPAINSPDGIAPCVFLQLPNPGRDYDVFSRDHDEDYSIVPSVQPGTIPLSSPDLWVRPDQDDGYEHESPKSGTVNFIYARVYNLGCNDPGDVTVNFYWADSCTELMQPDNFIGSGAVTGLSAGGWDLVSAKWEVDLVAGDYCLIAEVTTDSETPTNQALIASDNNKVQIELVVLEDT